MQVVTRVKRGLFMVFRLDGCSFMVAHPSAWEEAYSCEDVANHSQCILTLIQIDKGIANPYEIIKIFLMQAMNI